MLWHQGVSRDSVQRGDKGRLQQLWQRQNGGQESTLWRAGPQSQA